MSDPIELTITGVTYGGHGIGRHEGKAIFVPFALPGDQVLVTISEDKGRFAFGVITEVITPSPDRVMARCRHFGVCGGCHWQHADYAAQLRYKQSIVRDQLQRIGGIREAIVHPTIASPDPWQYRTHVTFHTASDGRLGYIAQDDQTVLAIEECHIIRPPLMAMFEQHIASTEHPRVRFQVGSADSDRAIAVGSHDEYLLTGEGVTEYTIRDHRFQVSAGSFFQVNLMQTETLIEQVMSRLALTGRERVLDLYSGVGLFTAFLAQASRAVIAIESFGPAVSDARVNLASFTHVEILQDTVERVLFNLKGKVDAVVLDPPRAGMKPDALRALISKKPRQIIYVSCDPSTLARDLKGLIKAGYRLIDAQPIDMFPHTYHIETIAHLRYGE
ncbi:MAG: class I SAM-dependent RNA methyltransferase [Anaerolineae bacterium]|jgi:23S rRNA (uracil1939-C5)-methyltransferase|nr:class I SAM-dependent RNA methyltransferase [Anaerolineae bacterium]